MSFEARETGTATGAPLECYRFSQGSSLWLWTSADRSVVLPSGTYSPTTLTRGDLDHSNEDEGGSLQLTVPRTNQVAQLFAAEIPSTPVLLTVFRCHRGEETDVRVRFVGSVSAARLAGPEAVLLCQPWRATFRRTVPALRYQSQCNWSLYGTGCGVSPTAFRDLATVGSVAGAVVTSPDFAVRADHWFRNGWLEAPGGERRWIVAHVGNSVTLMYPLSTLLPGQQVSVYAGCDRTESACATKFANLANHFGFPRIPTRNPHGGSVI